jgi:hypothetical protein
MVGGCDGACGIQEVVELASGVFDVRQTGSFIYFGAPGRGAGLKVRSQQVEFSRNISTHLQADPIGILER